MLSATSEVSQSGTVPVSSEGGKEDAMHPLTLSLIVLSLLSGTGFAVEKTVKKETREPSQVRTYEATFSPDSKQVLLAGLVWWESNAPRQQDMAYFVRLVDVASGQEIWKIVRREEL